MKDFKWIKFLLISISTLILLLFHSCSEDTTVEPSEKKSITISPEGGDYTFADGIVLKVPLGAVNRDTKILIRHVNISEVQSIYSNRGISIDNLLACIEGTPDGLVFNHPVQLILSVDLQSGDIPVVHEVNLINGSYTTSEIVTICDPEQNKLIISLDHFSTYTAETMNEIKELLSSKCGDTLCRCLRIRITQDDKDYVCNNGECQIAETRMKISFLDCDEDSTEEFYMKEISTGCTPSLKVSADRTKVPIEEHALIHANMKLGCVTLEDYEISFALEDTPLATINPANTYTDLNGDAFATLSAGNQEGLVKVITSSNVSYHSFTLYARAGGQEETVNGPLVSSVLINTLDIEIEKDSVENNGSWSGNVIADVVTVYDEVHLEIDFHFFVDPLGDGISKEVVGIANATQDVTIKVDNMYNVFNLNLPEILNLIINGNVVEDNNRLFLGFLIDDAGTPFYTYDLVGSDPGSPTWNIKGISILSLSKDEIIPLNEGTYSGTDTGPPGVTYTITLNKVPPL